MNLRFGRFMFGLVKFVLMLLLLGIGVHFGIITPRGYSLNYAGIFEDSIQSVIFITLMTYLIYRWAVMLARVRAFAENDNETTDKKSNKPTSLYKREIILFAFVIFPILFGLGLTNKLIEVNELIFHILRNFVILITVVSVGYIYLENVEFSSAK